MVPQVVPTVLYQINAEGEISNSNNRYTHTQASAPCFAENLILWVDR
ncbi:hypothetical protein [Mucilaginibacter conchicola]|nr:hypothetical protein [Mucilaginibacter conchicola]